MRRVKIFSRDGGKEALLLAGEIAEEMTAQRFQSLIATGKFHMEVEESVAGGRLPVAGFPFADASGGEGDVAGGLLPVAGSSLPETLEQFLGMPVAARDEGDGNASGDGN